MIWSNTLPLVTQWDHERWGRVAVSSFSTWILGVIYISGAKGGLDILGLTDFFAQSWRLFQRNVALVTIDQYYMYLEKRGGRSSEDKNTDRFLILPYLMWDFLTPPIQSPRGIFLSVQGIRGC